MRLRRGAGLLQLAEHHAGNPCSVTKPVWAVNMASSAPLAVGEAALAAASMRDSSRSATQLITASEDRVLGREMLEERALVTPSAWRSRWW